MEWELIPWGEPILQNNWIIWFRLLYFNLKKLKGLNSVSLIRFHCTLQDSEVFFSVFQNVLKWKRVANIAEWLNYLVPPSTFRF